MILDRGVGMWAWTEGPRSELVGQRWSKRKEVKENEEDTSFSVGGSDSGG